MTVGEGRATDQSCTDEVANEAVKGIDRMGSLRLLLALGGRELEPAAMAKLAERKNAHYVELAADVTPGDLLPGVTGLLAETRAAGLRLAVASASRNAPVLLQRLGIADRFDFVADAGAVANPKPAPDIFLACATAIGAAPARCVGFEDAAAGVEAIRGAGMVAVGIGDPTVLGRAHLVFPSTATVDLARVLGLADDQPGR